MVPSIITKQICLKNEEIKKRYFDAVVVLLLERYFCRSLNFFLISTSPLLPIFPCFFLFFFVILLFRYDAQWPHESYFFPQVNFLKMKVALRDVPVCLLVSLFLLFFCECPCVNTIVNLPQESVFSLSPPPIQKKTKMSLYLSLFSPRCSNIINFHQVLVYLLLRPFLSPT